MDISSAFFAIFKNGELMLEWNTGTDCWGLPRRMLKKIPDGRYVEMIFNDVLREICVHVVEMVDFNGLIEAQRVFDSPLYVCTIGSQANGRNLEVANFWNKRDISDPSRFTVETRVAFSIPFVKDRFL